MAKLVKIDGGEPPLEYIIGDNEEVTIGRGLQCKIVLTDLGISRHHCTIKKQGNKYTITDRSSNGIFINDIHFNNTFQELKSNDIITINQNNFKFVLDSPRNTRPVIEEVIVLEDSMWDDAEIIILEDDYYLNQRRDSLVVQPIEIIEPLILTKVPKPAHLCKPSKPIPAPIQAPSTSKAERNDDVFKEELTCCICSDLFINAVFLNCSHSFCSYCLDTWMTKNKNKLCPVCRALIKTRTPARTLDNLVQVVVSGMTKEERAARDKEINARQPKPIAPVTIPSITIPIVSTTTAPIRPSANTRRRRSHMRR